MCAKHWLCGWAICLRVFDETVRDAGMGNDLAVVNELRWGLGKMESAKAPGVRARDLVVDI